MQQGLIASISLDLRDFDKNEKIFSPHFGRKELPLTGYLFDQIFSDNIFEHGPDMGDGF